MRPFIHNPRRYPRGKLRCVVRVATKEQGHWLTYTRDFSAHGCQLEAPGAVEPGTKISVEVLDERAGPALFVAGEVAWCTAAAPFRIGVCFDQGTIPAATRFFERLAAGRPSLCTEVNAPERLHAATPLAPAPPPESVEPALTEKEIRVLRTLGAGRSAGSLAEDLRTESALHALFALLARRYVAIGNPDPAAARRWAPLLDRVA